MSTASPQRRRRQVIANLQSTTTTITTIVFFTSICLLSRCAGVASITAAEDAPIAGLNITITAPPDGFSTAPDAIAFYAELSLPIFSISTVRIHFTAPGGQPATKAADNRVRFATLQLHSCFQTVSLSRNRTLQAHHHQNGTNLGLIVHRRRDNDAAAQIFYLHNRNYHTNATVAVALVAYDALAPQPGACSMELPMDEVPVLQVHDGDDDDDDDGAANSDFVEVDTPLAADANGDCQQQQRFLVVDRDHNVIGGGGDELRYTFYHLFLKRGDFTCRTYFDGIRQMLTVSSVRSSTNVSLSSALPYKPQRATYVRQPGTGVVFATLVRSVRTNADEETAEESEAADAVAAYVPAYTMFCAPLGWRTDCDIFAGPGFKMLATVLMLVGLVRAYLSPVLPWAGAPFDGFVVGMMLMLWAETTASHWWPVERLTVAAETGLLVGAGCLMAVLVAVLMFVCPAAVFVTELLAHVLVGFIAAAYTTDTFAAFGFAALKSSAWWVHAVVLLTVLAVVMLTVCLVPRVWGVIVMGAAWGTFALYQGTRIIWPVSGDGGGGSGAHGAVLMRNMVSALRSEEFR